MVSTPFNTSAKLVLYKKDPEKYLECFLKDINEYAQSEQIDDIE